MTSMKRRTSNPGKREREARKRHRRGMVYDAATAGWLKLGHKHSSRSFRCHVSDCGRWPKRLEPGRVMSLLPEPVHQDGLINVVPADGAASPST